MNDELTELAELQTPDVPLPATPTGDPSPPTCSNCVSYHAGRFFGTCRHWPLSLPVRAGSLCSQHRRVIDLAFVTDTTIDAIPLNLSARTIAVLRRAKLRTVEDLIDAGRDAVRTNGALDRHAIREISAKLREFGISW